MHCSIMGYSSQICDKIFKVLLVTNSVDWFLQKDNPQCLCVCERSDLDRVRGLPCSHASLYYKSSPETHPLSPVTVLTEPRLLSHCCVTHTKAETFSCFLSTILLLMIFWPNEVAENGERKKCPRGQIHTDTLRQVQVYKCRSSEHQRFFLTSKMLLHWNMVGDQYVCSNYLISAIDINDSYSLYKKQKS